MMRPILTISACCLMLLGYQSAMADPPDISYNVVVVQNASSSQCPTSWHGNADTDSAIDISRFGSDTVQGAGVESCTGCAINSNGDCSCHTCYSYFNGN